MLLLGNFDGVSPTLPPASAGDTAFRLFCTPILSERRQANHRQLAERARYHLRNAAWQRVTTALGGLQAYIFEPERKIASADVLIVHGWTSEASFMTAVGEAIRRAGFRVILFDLPAHGLSDGRTTNLMDCARATALIGGHFGPFHAVVAHSFGGLISLVAAEGRPPMPRALETKKMVLIASPNRLLDVTEEFSRHWGLTHAAQRQFERRLERLARRPLKCFSVADLLRSSGPQALVLHARDDVDVSFRRAEEIASAVEGVELCAFDGLGHRNILFASQVVRRIVSFLNSK